MTALLVSDDLLEREVVHSLIKCAATIHDLGVVAIDGKVRLCGIVDSYLEKRRAEELAWRADGVRQVINQLRVIPC